MESKIIKFKKLVPEATIPTYAHNGDIGMDVFATSVEYCIEHDCYIYHTGIACETSGHMGVFGMMKSSIFKHGDAYLVNAVGLIDSDQYRGEIIFVYKNRVSIEERAIREALKEWSKKSLWYKLTHKWDYEYSEQLIKQVEKVMIYKPYEVGEAIGQLVPITFDSMSIKETTNLTSTERGTGGFGSSAASKKKVTKNYKKKPKPPKELNKV